MYFVLYKTTNKINGKFYVGIHRTENLNDGYLGSGKNLKIAIKKYGKENFLREIIKECSSYKELVHEEKKIVTEDFCKRRDTYNSDIGGSGGKVWSEELRQKMSESKKGSIPWNKGKSVGSFLTEEGKEKLRSRMIGAGNHMYGIDVASRMTPEANNRRLEKLSASNRKPKSKVNGYMEYAKKRFWIVNKDNKLSHCTSMEDPRILSGEYIVGRKWEVCGLCWKQTTTVTKPSTLKVSKKYGNTIHTSFKCECGAIGGGSSPAPKVLL